MYALDRTKLSFQKDFNHFPIFEILISEAPNIRNRVGLPRAELGIGKGRAPPQASIARMARLPGYPRSPRSTC